MLKKAIKYLSLFLIVVVSKNSLAQTTIYNYGVNITNSNTEINLNGSYDHEAGTITNSGVIYIKENILNNSNNQIFNTNEGKVIFNGDQIQKVNGSSMIHFNKLEMNKPANILQLNQSIIVADTLSLVKGSIDLNSNNIDLVSSGVLNGENNSNKIFGKEGVIKAVRNIRNPKLSENIAGLGICISSSENFSNTIIERGHTHQIFYGDTSILRYYHFNSSSSGMIDTMKFFYLDNSEIVQGEELYKIFSSSDDGMEWRNRGGLVDTSNNFVLSTTVSPPEISNTRFSIFPIESFATCLPNDPNFVSAIFLVTTSAFDGDSIKCIQLSSSNVQNYSWNFGDGSSSEEYSPTHIYHLQDPSLSHLYPMSMTVSNGLCSDTRKKNITIKPALGNPKIASLFSGIEYFNIYPNPNSGSFNIEVKTTHESEINIHIIDMHGRLLERKFIRGSNYQEEINLETLNDGMYFIKLQAGKESRVLKMIKY